MKTTKDFAPFAPPSSRHNAINVLDQLNANWNVRMLNISVDYLMSESRKTDVALRQDCKVLLLALPSKSRLLLLFLTNLYGEVSICWGTNCLSVTGAVLICCSKVTTYGRATSIEGIT